MTPVVRRLLQTSVAPYCRTACKPSRTLPAEAPLHLHNVSLTKASVSSYACGCAASSLRSVASAAATQRCAAQSAGSSEDAAQAEPHQPSRGAPKVHWGSRLRHLAGPDLACCDL